MDPDYPVKIFIFFHSMILLYVNLFVMWGLSLFYIIVGTTFCMISFILEYINSVEQPLFVKFRQVVKSYLRMVFWIKTYRKVGYYDEAIKKGDSYIDELLKDMFEKKGEEYDPYALEDSAVGFHKKVMFVNVTGEAKLYDGHIKGLKTLHRVQHCSLHDEGNKLRVKADLGAGELKFHYRGTVKFMNFGPTITIDGLLSYIEVHMEFKVNSRTGKEGKLTKFIIDDMRGMNVRVTGLGPLNWAVNPIISGVTKIFKRFVRNFMENKVEKHIREHIPNYQFPIVGGENTEVPETVPTETEGPEETTPSDTLPPETEAPEETPEPDPETEAPEETPETEPETEAPEETPEPEPETVGPEETPEPEPETVPPEETLEPETEARGETESDPEADVLEVSSESEPEDNLVVTDEIYLPETPDTSSIDEISSDEIEDVSEPEE